MTRLAPAIPSNNATVMASAGTGKTWLLVTRLVRLLLAGARPEGILAITFTRKAAAEMQTRLTQRLYDMAAADNEHLSVLLEQQGVIAEKKNLDRARHLYEMMLHTPQTVRTSTFHAFCQEILRRFPLEAGVSPGFELLESCAALQQEAWDALFNEATMHPDAELSSALDTLFLHCGSLFGTRTALQEFLQHRSDWWAYTDNHPDPVSFASHELQSQLDIGLDKNPVKHFFSTTCRKKLLEFAHLLTRHKTKTNSEQAATLFRCLETENIEPLFPEIREIFLTQKNEPRKREPNKTRAKAMGEKGQERFVQLHDELSSAILELLQQLAAQQTLRLSSAWFLAGHRLIEHYQRIKEEQRLLDFADLEWKSYKLFNTAGSAHWVQYKLDQRIDHLLIDEFQDTNPTQWRLILPLLEEMAAGEPERPRSVFLVGDSKQSIYRFRRAEPQLFDTANRWLIRNLNAHSYSMAKSWRSAPAIMEFVNELFGSGELNRRLPHFPPHDTHHKQLWGRVELLPLIEPDKPAAEPGTQELRNPLQQPRPPRTDQRYYQEGQQIAATIRSLTEQPVIINDGTLTRPLNYGDILILIARRTHLPAIETALRNAGIPYLGANRGTLLESQEIMDMEALLETLTMPYNNLSLAVVLRSPLFACSDRDLVALASEEQGNWWERLMKLSALRGSPLARARQRLAEWHALTGHLPVHDLLQRIYSEGNVPARYEAAFPAHLRSRVRANLQRFLQLALEVDSGRYPSLSHFLARLQELRDLKQDAPDEAPTCSGEPQVRLMTIHAAKGLEAPVVFLADSASSSKQKSGWNALINWPADQSRPSHFLLAGKKQGSDPLTHSLLEQQTGAQQREDANLLYVAVTRARQLLYISASAPGRGSEYGWYGYIREQFAEKLEDAATGGVICESGAAPDSTQHPESSSLSEAGEPDPRLHQMLHITPDSSEIAPSRQGSHPASEGDPDGRQRGIIIHRMLELLTHEPAVGDRVLLHRISAETGISCDTPLLAECQREALSVLHEPRLRFLFDRKHYTSAYNEIPLIYELNGKTIHGVIDRLLLSDDEIILIDYKTHQHATPETVPQLANTYQQQMQLYTNGVRRLWPEKPLRSLLLFTACRSIYTIT